MAWNAVRHTVCPSGTRRGTAHGTRRGTDALRCWVQNQNQNQSSSTAVRGVSIKACIRRQGREGTTPATMHAALRAEIGGQ